VNPRTYGIDRVLAVVVGLLLLGGGVWVVAWSFGLLPAGWWSPASLTLGLDDRYADDPWWPLVLGLLGLFLTAVGLAWFVSHFRSRRVSRLSLPGDAEGGRLLVEGSALAKGAADALAARSAGVAAADGKLLEHGRHVVLDLTASVRPDADLAEVSRSCEEVLAHAVDSTGRRDLTARIRLTVARRSRPAARVH
jgi:hypothetical protein